MRTGTTFTLETLNGLAKGAELASNGHFLANLGRTDWRLWPERSPSYVVRHKVFLLNGEGPPNREHLYAQIVHRLYEWLMDAASEHRGDFEIVVYAKSEDILDNGRNISEWSEEYGVKDEALKKAGTGISASMFPTTVFGIEVLWMMKGETYPYLLEEFARVLTNAIYEKYANRPPKPDAVAEPSTN